jgi:hypothetical protein
MKKLLIVLVALGWAGVAAAAELAGVAMPDTAVVAGKTLRLNGLGLRTKVFFKIYVGGLYLESPTSDGEQAAGRDEVKRVVMHFLYKRVTRQQLVDAWNEGFEENSPDLSRRLSAEIAKFNSWMSDVTAGQEIVVTYEPGSGTTVEVAGQAKGSIPGADFMRALFRVWLGPHPPTSSLKAGMLGTK